MSRHQRIADRIGIACVGYVDGATDRRLAPPVGPDLATIRDGQVIDPLVGFAASVEPALDDLYAIEVGTIRVGQRADHDGVFFSAGVR